jgi:hypothetical protein
LDKVPFLNGNSPDAYPTRAASGVPSDRRVKATVGRGRARLQVWPELHIGTVIKHTVKHHLTHITRQMAHGMLERATALLTASRGGAVLNTAFIERFNGSATSTYLLTLSEATHEEVCW